MAGRRVGYSVDQVVCCIIQKIGEGKSDDKIKSGSNKERQHQNQTSEHTNVCSVMLYLVL